MANHKEFLSSLLAQADVKINGDRPWDMKVNDERLYARLISGGSLALGESYIDGWWDSESVDGMIERILRAKLGDRVSFNLPNALNYLGALLVNGGAKKRAFEIGEKHYDTGNDLFKAMLDTRMVYTCAYWKNADGTTAKDLDQAQENKLDLVCRKLGLKKGQTVLDIGCGWGSFAKFTAEKYGVKVVGVTVSKEQQALGMEMCKGLPVEIRLQDYRDVDEKFDHIVSLGMFEHVHIKQYRTYMKVAERCLKDGGLFLLHTIGSNVTSNVTDPWISKYIFPNSKLPSLVQIGKAIEGVFVMEDWHNFGPYYDKTLMAWYENFNKHWPELKARYGDRFYRMWKYYLLACAGSFRAREIQLWQIVLSKKGVEGGYVSVR